MCVHLALNLAVGALFTGAGAGGAGGGGAGATTVAVPFTRSRRFGDPAPSPVTTPTVASDTSAPATSDGEADGWDCRYRAAAPATCGVDIEVPLATPIAVSSVFQADQIRLPGAKISTQLPKSENCAIVSSFMVAPTVIACGADAGETVHASEA